MGIARLLSKQKLVYTFAIFLLVLGCDTKMVSYKDFLIKPVAVRSDDFIKIKQGSTVASSAWIKSEIRIAQDEILISGKLTLLEQPTVLSIKLPAPSKKYRIYWINEDLTKTEIMLSDKDRITAFHIYGTTIEHGSNKSLLRVGIFFYYQTNNQMGEIKIGSSEQNGHFDFNFEQWWGFGDPIYKTKANEVFKLIFRREGYNDKIISYDLGKLSKKGNIVEVAIDQVILEKKEK